MDMPKRSAAVLALLTGLLMAGAGGGVSRAQEIQPRSPIIEPGERESPPAVGRDEPREGPELIPLPEAANRTSAAALDRVRVTTVLPASWSGIVASYQPHWTGIVSPTGFGLHGWTTYFSAAALSPVVVAHPFFGPWGTLAYDGWLLDRYRAVWTSARAPERLAGAAVALHAGDRAMAEGRVPDAVDAYRSATQAAPDFALGYLGLGAALAELGRDDEAARAFRQSIDRYPGWLALTVDWTAFYGREQRLGDVRAGVDQRALSGPPASRFVSGVLHLFGDDPQRGRQILSALGTDPHAQTLLARGPR